MRIPGAYTETFPGEASLSQNFFPNVFYKRQALVSKALNGGKIFSPHLLLIFSRLAFLHKAFLPPKGICWLAEKTLSISPTADGGLHQELLSTIATADAGLAASLSAPTFSSVLASSTPSYTHRGGGGRTSNP